MKPIYAVVDLETTGTDPKTDRIIQFGCVLVQDGQIINRFATDINPIRHIPKQIQSLTNISNQQVKHAPYFEDVADTIFHLLSDTIFVAHNIYFDYHFLNHELTRCGLSELKISGIDTVELAQVFLPNEGSFRLNDLAESIGLAHDSPHQADSDAEVTAALLLYIEALMRELPLLTLEKIHQLSGQMGMQTSDFIKRVLDEERKKIKPQQADLMIVDGIVLKKKSVPLFEAIHFEQHYPKEKAEKQKVFKKTLRYRKEQARLMNTVYQHFNQQEEKNLLIEAETGMGKTIGYLFPAAYLATPENPVIVSTISVLLQQQILRKDIPLINRFLSQPIQATVVKSHRHYIDLQRFKATLVQPVPQKQYALYQMAILVWLTKTVTGDFDELNLVRLDHPLFVEIRHRGVAFLAKKQSFYEEDFVRHLYACMAQSNVLIVNHAFLMQEDVREEPLLPKSSYLVIDEAQHLPSIADKMAHQRIDLQRFKRKILQMSEDGLLKQIGELLHDEYELNHLFSLFLETVIELMTLYEAYFQTLTGLPEEKVMVVKAQVRYETLMQDKILQKILLFYQDINSIQDQLRTLLEVRNNKWLNRERVEIAQLLDLFDEITQQGEVFEQWAYQWQPRFIHSIELSSDRQNAVIELFDLDAEHLLQMKWYQRYEKIIYIGGTIKVPGDKTYFAKRLGIPEAPIKTIPSVYDYQKQTQLLIIEKGVPIQQITTEDYARYLAETLDPILFGTKQSMMVLFTSHDILQRVYVLLNRKALNQGREIIAQGMGGTREKIVKRFLLAEAGILFGTDSFWEGIDLPGETLQVVIVTRLPFENPQRPLVQARHAYLEQEGINPFLEDALPKATLKLRQALGRLIRSDQDKGILVVLDRRILSTKYGKRMLKGLPKKMPQYEADASGISERILHFFEENLL